MNGIDAIERRIVARIVHVRQYREISQRQLAAAAGLSRDIVWALEAGRRHLRFDEAAALCAALGVDLVAVVSPEPLVLRTEVQFE